ncbi:MAG: winged helix-turn-helix transcriptional regulator [Deltaproteobacteria bacterium]|nr:winged helix-turn-helix transcriptional regulator [Deltaproteobacteria bacterium]
MHGFQNELQLFVRRFGLLNAACCDQCCGESVSLVQSHVLAVIRSLDCPSIQEVAGELGVDVTTFSRQVKRLEAKGLVCRRVSPEDRRVNRLLLTDEGARVLGQIDRFMATRIEAILGSMTPFEREVTVRSLEALNRAMGAAGSCCGPSICNMQQDETLEENR